MAISRQKEAQSLDYALLLLNDFSELRRRVFPCKGETLAQWWFDVGPPSTTLAQPQTTIVPASRAC